MSFTVIPSARRLFGHIIEGRTVLFFEAARSVVWRQPNQILQGRGRMDVLVPFSSVYWWADAVHRCLVRKAPVFLRLWDGFWAIRHSCYERASQWVLVCLPTSDFTCHRRYHRREGRKSRRRRIQESFHKWNSCASVGPKWYSQVVLVEIIEVMIAILIVGNVNRYHFSSIYHELELFWVLYVCWLISALIIWQELLWGAYYSEKTEKQWN